MFDFFKSIKWGMLFMSIVTVAGGVMIAMNPANSVEMIIRVIGGILMAGGVLLVLGYLLDKKSGMSGFLDIIIGALMLVAGLALFIRPKTFELYINIIFAVILGVHGLNMLIEAFRGIKYKDRKLLTTILMALICMGLAALVYFNPFNTANTLMFVVGIALILDGLLLFVVAIRRGLVVRKFHIMQKEAAEAEKAAEAAAAALEEKKAAEEAKLAIENPTFGKPAEEAAIPEPKLEFKEPELKQEPIANVEEIEKDIKEGEVPAVAVAEQGQVAEVGSPAKTEEASFDAPQEGEKKSIIKRFFD